MVDQMSERSEDASSNRPPSRSQRSAASAAAPRQLKVFSIPVTANAIGYFGAILARP